MDGLLHLLEATSKDSVVQVLDVTVQNMYSSEKPSSNLSLILDIEEDKIAQLAESSKLFIKNVIFNDLCDAESLKGLFSGDFDRKLRDLLIKIVLNKYQKWRKLVIENQVSTSKLESYSYEIVDNTNFEPKTCVLSIQTNEQSTKVAFDMQTLETMIDSLSKIRDQISSVVQ